MDRMNIGTYLTKNQAEYEDILRNGSRLASAFQKAIDDAKAEADRVAAGIAANHVPNNARGAPWVQP